MAVINGSGLSELHTGGIEDDVINALGGDDTLDGGAGGIDTLNGGTGNDLLYTRTDDNAFGGDGDDFIALQGNTPGDLDGGIGNDTLRFDGGYDISGSTLTGIENLFTNGVVFMTAAQLGSFLLVAGYNAATTTSYVALTQGGTINVTLSATLTSFFQLYGSSQADIVTFNPGHLFTINANMGDGNDRVTSGAGADSLRGDDGNDTLIGLGGNDTLDGGIGADVLTGGNGNDYFLMSVGDRATGAAGDDFFSIYDSQIASVNGGSGIADSLRFEGSYDISGTTVTLVENALLNGNDSMTAAQMDAFTTLSGYSAAHTTASVFLTQGGTAAVVLAASLTGTFTLNGSGDADVISFNPGHLGAITANMGGGDDQIRGASGLDSLRGDSGNDSLFGLSGDDSLDGGIGRDSMDGGTGNDYLVARAYDTVLGGGGDDLISVQESLPSVLNGGTGTSDTLRFESGYDISGTTLIGIELANLNGNVLMTAAQMDAFTTLSGYASNYTTATLSLTQGGVAGVSLSATLTNNFTLNGSGAADLITFDPAYFAIINANMGGGDDLVISASGADNLFGGSGNDTLTALDGNDVMDGGDGLDSLDGGAGNDTLVVRAFDTLLGGLGDDLFSIQENSPAVLNGGANYDTLRFETSYDITGTTLIDMDQANLNGANSMTATQLGSFALISGYAAGYTSATVYLTQAGTAAVTLSNTLSASFTLYGSTGADIISFNPGYFATLNVHAGHGNDSITGASGADNLRGEFGMDTLLGMAGNDYLDGGALADSLDGGSGNDVLIARQSDRLYGGDNDDLISVQESLPAVLSGGAGGNDTLRFEAGYDITGATLTGIEVLAANGIVLMTAAQLETFNKVTGYGAGSLSAQVRLTVGGTASVVLDTALTSGFTLTGSGTADIISFNAIYPALISVYAGFGNDSITGANGADFLRGEGGNDTLNGANGNDTLDGGTGADVLIGGTGEDSLTGGLGRDTFSFSTVSSSIPATPDRINDFEVAGSQKGDLIDVSGIDANSGLAGNDAFIFGVAVSQGTLSLVDSGTDTLVQMNTDADAAFEIVILIADGAVLASAYSAADFIL